MRVRIRKAGGGKLAVVVTHARALGLRQRYQTVADKQEALDVVSEEAVRDTATRARIEAARVGAVQP